MTVVNQTIWSEFYDAHNDAHLLQSPHWAALKGEFGWFSQRVITGDIGSQILFRKLPFGFTIAYIARGPVGNLNHIAEHILEIDAVSKKHRAIFLKIEPDIWEDEESCESARAQLSTLGSAAKPIQPRQTLMVSLEGDDEEWLSRMKQKTRYNIRLAQKKEVLVQETEDIHTFQQLMEITGERNEFGVHSFAYYRKAFEEFYPQACRIFLASFNDLPLAAIMVFYKAQKAMYFYGASSNQERNRMPTYLVQFRAMQWAASIGCKDYDLWGIPDVPLEELEASFADRDDGLWGVYRFKRGFGGVIKRSMEAYDRVYMPALYKLYQWKMSD
ncbi:MAG TPA: peptidoglycan bridge formation glycyltransferase FemA/FemB family protein [Chloroflexi bacterium]|nr:peptidoglycan bridge formation glycyltransferase FemA/FemB family protein [Chloroflexota bacterium]